MVNLICITCPVGCALQAEKRENDVTVAGHKCKKGIEFATAELTAPTRTLTSTVKTVFKDLPVVPVRTNGEIPKETIKELMPLLKTVTIDKLLSRGDTVIDNILGTGIQLIITTDMKLYHEAEETNG